MSVRSILCVDDSPSDLRMLETTLTGAGYVVATAQNGKQAVEAAARIKPDLVFMDVNMPEMDGREFVEYVRSRSWQRSVPILMVTSETDQGRLAAVEEAGVSGICDKPFEPAVVRCLLARMLSQGVAG